MDPKHPGRPLIVLVALLALNAHVVLSDASSQPLSEAGECLMQKNMHMGQVKAVSDAIESGELGKSLALDSLSLSQKNDLEHEEGNENEEDLENENEEGNEDEEEFENEDEEPEDEQDEEGDEEEEPEDEQSSLLHMANASEEVEDEEGDEEEEPEDEQESLLNTASASEDDSDDGALKPKKKKTDEGPTRRRCRRTMVNCGKMPKDGKMKRCHVILGVAPQKKKTCKCISGVPSDVSTQKARKRCSTYCAKNPNGGWEKSLMQTKGGKKEKRKKKKKRSLLQAGLACMGFPGYCSGSKKKNWCGLETKQLGVLAGNPDGLSALPLCFKTVFTKLGYKPGGGYAGKVPAWYMYRDYKNIHKCIDEEMKAEKSFCDKAVSDKLKAKRLLFMQKMHDCAKKHGAGKFDELGKKCKDDAGVLAKMEKCKEDVTKEMMALRSED